MPRDCNRPAALVHLLRRPGRRLAGDHGVTMVEAVIGMLLFSMLMLAILSLFGTSWKTEVKAFTDQAMQRTARNLLYQIVNGNATAATPYAGLLKACEVITDPASSAIAYHVQWKDSAGVQHDDAVCYYRSGNQVYRVVSPYVAPLTILTSGGTEAAEWITTFEVSANGVIPVELLVVVTHPQKGTSITVQTRVTPRNLPTGP